MHILLTNDDGPPSPSASPYIETFIRTLTSAPFKHTVSVVLPTTQRSWIGKAHLLPPTTLPSGPSQKNEDVTDVIRPSYYDPTTGSVHPSLGALRSARRLSNDKSTSENGRPSVSELKWPDYYVLIPGTPATCTQLGLFHHDLLFPDFTAGANTPNSDVSQSPIDLVLSGPNYGRNTTAAFALSSGTIGGAMEGAVCGVRAIALSFAFFTRAETASMIASASHLGIKIVEALVRDWDAPPSSLPSTDSATLTPDIYSINIPLGDDVLTRPVCWTWMLDNKWSTGCLYKNIDPRRAGVPNKTGPGDATNGSSTVTATPAGQDSENGNGSDLAARSGPTTTNGIQNVVSNGNETGGQEEERETKEYAAPMFRWQPEFKNVWTTVEKSEPGNDGLVIRDRCTSVTPLKANFWGLWGERGAERFRGEVKL